MKITLNLSAANIRLLRDDCEAQYKIEGFDRLRSMILADVEKQKEIAVRLDPDIAIVKLIDLGYTRDEANKLLDG